MTRSMLRTGLAPALSVLVAIAACGGNKPEPAAQSGPTAEPTPTAEPSAAASVAWDALTRPKLREEEFRAAIRDLENANGAAEAAKDIGSGYRRLLGVPQPTGGWSKLPGVEIPREQIPEGVRLVKIIGVFDNTGDPHMSRYKMLAERYAKDYNSTMMRAVK